MDRPPVLNVAILVISDTAAAAPETDTTTAALRGLFDRPTPACTWQISQTQVVPDETSDIAAAIRECCDVETTTISGNSRPNLIVTTGGTGFASRDVTPEAVGPLLNRTAPGFV